MPVAILLLQASLSTEIGPSTADQALERLSSVTGQRLICSPELRREVLMIRVKNVPWEELKARIAKVTSATWRKRKDEWVLERPAALSRSLRDAVVDYRTRLLKVEVGKLASKSRRGRRRS